MLIQDKIVSRKEFIKTIGDWKQQGQKVVFSNGCFDIIHLGHVQYLERAAQNGDKLVIGVNSDASVSRLKGAQRPVTDELARASVLAAMQFVDLVTIFDEDTPLELITESIPNVLIKGDDYKVKDIVGAEVVQENGGSVNTIELVDGYSTTSIIEKIKKI